MASPDAKADGEVRTPPIEILLGLLGGATVLALVGFLLLAALGGEGQGDPEVRVELLGARAIGAGWLVPFRAVNDGRAPASQLRLEALLELPDGRRERSEVVVDYLAGRSEEEGGFFFPADPGAGRLAARPLGFVRP